MVQPAARTAAAVVVTLLGLRASTVTSQPCSPNLCSGHGSCESSKDGSTSARQCSCNTGWTGADCSLMLCPLGPAWSDKAKGTDDAHAPAECSNRGYCDRLEGVCVCDTGFEGQACGRRTCPKNCMNHGRCQSMAYFASVQDPGEGTVHAYDGDVWDAEMMYGCNCDAGYSGPMCSLRGCAVGDDPLTGTDEASRSCYFIFFDPDGEQYNEQQELTCAATGGSFTLTFRGFTTAAIAYSASSEDVVDALQDLPSLYGSYDTAVSVQFSSSDTQACTSPGHLWTIEFLQDFGDLPLLVAGVSKLTHSTSGIAASVTVEEVITGTKESLDCSGRGLCDTDDRVCTCEPEYDTSNGYNEEGRRGDCGYVITAVTHCPGEISCSGHGVCSGSPTYACDCSDGWEGADCSLKTCPFGKSWFMRPTADNVAHLTRTECSDMGTCDRVSGECACVDGFEGSACDRMSCPGAAATSSVEGETGGGTYDDSETACNGHGQCMTMAMLAEATDENGVATDYTYGGTPNDPLTWDHDMVQGCLCDDGYEGHDCSLRTCPYGDDPDTHSQDNEIQEVECFDADDDGQVVFMFRQAETSALEVSATEAEVEAAFEALSTLTDVAVSCGNGALCNSTVASTCTIEFLTELGDVPLVSASVSNIDSIAVSEFQTGTKEWAECSFKGLCDYSTGTCECFPGYGSSDGQNNKGSLGDCGYVLPFSGGLFETGVYAPISRYPTITNLRSGNTAGTFDTAGRTTDELAARLAELKNMQEEDPWAD
ncbi:unnamed protein product [Ectocarpus sp. 12 AP-2014]